MIRFRALGVNFTLPLLTLIVPVLALRLGMRGGMFPLLLALGIHELAHLAAARLARVEIAEIRLMPFGGSARIENPYRLSPAQLIPTALAGPAANLSLAVLLAALAQWNVLSAICASEFIAPNLILTLFNLIPALPLDGGRVLYALLQRPLGERRALALCLWTSRALALLLAILFLRSGLQSGVWNLTFLLAAIFLLASGRDETGALSAARAQSLNDALEGGSDPRPARIYQLDAHTSARRALALIHPRELAWFVLTSGGAPSALIDGRSVVAHLVAGGSPDAALMELPAYHLAGTSLRKPGNESVAVR